ncbi:tRNA pseudouridine(38-40) synthase TruA [Lactovum miscens]|uniref:tRNA pseudouridine synthase A n=1 Tax=Lactovum miscens TaxID=190387 RepID=A0A841C884_9LACT|nr:tRNA pseudouridine(38-40) synthase TruA [Lactovum miscens]MBB5888517.1 tRNA pseudouridine38-40 synthase [Lactovum miscens]
MTRFKATISYDGSDFAGFQEQPGRRTVQSEIEKVLQKLNSGKELKLWMAGRTDSGVHACGQVIHFDLEDPRPVERIRFALDTQTPADISIWKLEVVASDFHARFTPHEKIYEYLLDNSVSRSPFKRRSQAWFRYRLDLGLMQEAASKIVGTHDFEGFTAAGGSVKDKVRTISLATVEKIDESSFRFRFRGSGFLYKQVRNMVGTLIKIGNGKFPVDQIDKILSTGNRHFAGPTAHPEGLYLKEVIYNEDRK